VGLLNVHGRARCPSRGWYAKEPHDKGEKAVGFTVSTTTGIGGGVRGLKNKISLGLQAFRGDKLRLRAWLPVSRNVADRVWVGQHYVHNTGQSNSPRTVQGQQRQQESKQAEKQAGWRKSGSEKGRGKWKVGDKTQGGGGGGRSKKNFGEKKNRRRLVGAF
jgi:hypothetical protein